MSSPPAWLSIGDEILRRIGGGVHPGRPSLILNGIYSGEKVSLSIVQPGGDEILAKMAAGAVARRRLRAEEHALEQIGRISEFAAFSRAAPRRAGFFETPVVTVHVQERLAGLTLQEYFLRNPPSSEAALARTIVPVVKILMNPVVTSIEGSVTKNVSLWKDSFDRFIRIVEDSFDQIDQDTSSIHTRVMHTIDSLRNSCWQHGDFFMKNVLFCTEGDGLVRVVDWEDFSEHWPPLFDLYLFLITLFPWRTGPGYFEKRLRLFDRIFFGRGPLTKLTRRMEEHLWSHWQKDTPVPRTELLLLALSMQADRLAERLGDDSEEFRILVGMAVCLVHRLAGTANDLGAHREAGH